MRNWMFHRWAGKYVRKALFWLHLGAGVVAGIIIFVMSITGVLLTFERQMTDWADRHAARVIPPAGASRLPLSDLIAKAARVWRGGGAGLYRHCAITAKTRGLEAAKDAISGARSRRGRVTGSWRGRGARPRQ
jgi:hypothetical protein